MRDKQPASKQQHPRPAGRHAAAAAAAARRRPPGTGVQPAPAPAAREEQPPQQPRRLTFGQPGAQPAASQAPSPGARQRPLRLHPAALRARPAQQVEGSVPNAGPGQGPAAPGEASRSCACRRSSTGGLRQPRPEAATRPWLPTTGGPRRAPWAMSCRPVLAQLIPTCAGAAPPRAAAQNTSFAVAALQAQQPRRGTKVLSGSKSGGSCQGSIPCQGGREGDGAADSLCQV